MKHDLESTPCHHIGLARNAMGSVVMCPECRVVHLSLLHMSLRFEVEAFEALADLLASARQQIGAVLPAHPSMAREGETVVDGPLH